MQTRLRKNEFTIEKFTCVKKRKRKHFDWLVNWFRLKKVGILINFHRHRRQKMVKKRAIKFAHVVGKLFSDLQIQTGHYTVLRSCEQKKKVSRKSTNCHWTTAEREGDYKCKALLDALLNLILMRKSGRWDSRPWKGTEWQTDRRPTDECAKEQIRHGFCAEKLLFKNKESTVVILQKTI